jgi:alkanesulfonate monooxygenase SsuD/methylene tetrahydromethanopterin reductase-like flavin-dependent oxidoreductase (luciferase family)
MHRAHVRAHAKAGVTHFALGVPNADVFADVEFLVTLAETAEDRGWDGFFVWDHLLYRENRPTVDPWIALGAITAATSTIRLGMMIAPLPRELPWEIAKRCATLDDFSGGRFLFGAGLGAWPQEHAAFGFDPDARTRADQLDESLEIIQGLWSGEPFAYDGRHFHIDAPPMNPPLAQPHLPIWIGGKWPARRPFRRAARYDGVFAVHEGYGKGSTMPPAALAEIVAYVREQRASEKPFDVAIEGTTPGDDVDSYVQAGLTWWVETLGWWRGGADAALARVDAGPPR